MKEAEAWRSGRIFLICLPLLLIVLVCGVQQGMAGTRIVLPEPRIQGGPSLADALVQRRTVRDYARREMTLEQLTLLLWAAQGINDPSGLRTAPSAGALYPLELVVVAGNIAGLENGIYRYRVQRHALERMVEGDFRARLARAAKGQAWIADGAAVLVLTAVYERTMRKYGDRGRRYVHIEVGHAAQNVLLQAAALKLGVGVVGAFDDMAVARVLELPAAEYPLYLLPVGWPTSTR